MHHWATACGDRSAANVAAFRFKDIADGFGWGDVRKDQSLVTYIANILMHPSATTGTVDTRDWWKLGEPHLFVPALCLDAMRRAAVVVARLRTKAPPTQQLVDAVRRIHDRMRVP